MTKVQLGIFLAVTSFALFSTGAFAQGDRSTITTAQVHSPSEPNVPPGGDAAPRPERPGGTQTDSDRDQGNDRDEDN